jgi:hypothetical protein
MYLKDKYSVAVASMVIQFVLCSIAFFAKACASHDNHEDYTKELCVIGVILLAGLLVLNLLMALIVTARRKVYLGVSMMVVASYFVFVHLGKQSINANRMWFVQSERLHYERIVDRVLQNRKLLKNTKQHFDQFSDYPFGGRYGVEAGTDDDGFVYIAFRGRGGNARDGYLYYPGDKMAAVSNNPGVCFLPNNPNYRYFHLNNAWYEYSN